MDNDDTTYRRSVRNTLAVMAVMVVVIAAGIYLLPRVGPPSGQFDSVTSVSSPFGLDLSLKLNATQLAPGQGESITAWLNGTANQAVNISAADNWQLGPRGLWTRMCTNGWPLGVGLMAGYYTTDNYSLGQLIPVSSPFWGCPTQILTPSSFLLQSRGSTAIVKVNGNLTEWNLATTLGLTGAQLSSQSNRVFTAIAADEWGDLAVAHFRVDR